MKKQISINPYQSIPQNILPIVEKWKDCENCVLCDNAFYHVFYRGVSPCEILFIGEAPGKKENLSGVPFVGRSGELLNGIIEDSGLELSYGITNIVACIPSIKDHNSGAITVRPPTLDEASACKNRLLETVEAASPKLIVILGKSAKKYMPRELSHIETLELPHPNDMNRNGGKNSTQYQSAVIYLQEELERLNV